MNELKPTAFSHHTKTMDVCMLDVEAYSPEHARRIASIITGGAMEHVIDVTEIKKPRNATTCKTDDHPVKGTRKWKTVYQVYAYGAKVPIGRGKYEYINMELVEDDIEQKTEAVKIAKDMAIKHQLPMTVQIAQKLETHDTACADIEPKTTKGKYRVQVIETK